jgi:hypothetical protein
MLVVFPCNEAGTLARYGKAQESTVIHLCSPRGQTYREEPNADSHGRRDAVVVTSRDVKQQKSHLRDTSLRELCGENATACTCKVSAIGTRVRVLNDAAQVRIRSGVAVCGVDERARLHGIDDGAPRLSVQRHLRVGY